MINCFPINLVQQRKLRKVEYIHNGKYVSLYYAKKVGIIFNASTEGIDKGVTSLINTFNARGVDYKGICIDFRKKGEGITRPFLPFVKVRDILKSDINWYHKPTDESINDFISEEYDIIIDLTIDKRNFTTDYILKNSKCSLLVGVTPTKEGLHDIIISRQEITPEMQLTPEQIKEININLVKNIINYLVTIK